jgi:hypothetical protein
MILIFILNLNLFIDEYTKIFGFIKVRINPKRSKMMMIVLQILQTVMVRTFN